MPKTSTPLPQLVADRIRATCRRIEQKIWSHLTPVPVEMGPLNQQFKSVEQAEKQKLQPVSTGEYFGTVGWTQRWFKVVIPRAHREERGRRHLIWNANGETTVYIDSMPWAGLDVAHLSCPVPDKACTLWLDTGTYQTMVQPGEAYNIDPYGCRFNGALLAVRNPEIWNIHHDFQVLWQLTGHLLRENGHYSTQIGYRAPIEECPPLLRRLLKRMDDLIDVYDQGDLHLFAKGLKKVYQDFPAESWGMKTGYTGHSHLDLVWLWPERVTYRKAIHTYSTVNRLMEQYPELIFSASQPLLLPVIKDTEPGLYKQLVRRVKEGRWELTGGMTVEFDTHLPTGEALARSIVYGQELFKETRGDISTVAWLPDVFGYNQFLPQIFALGGIHYFFTTKLNWSMVTRFPHHSFVWQGPDGTEIIAHLAAASSYMTQANARESIKDAERYRQSDVHDEILSPAGYGDGGGGISEEICERVQRLQNLATIPKAQWTTAESFFGRLNKVRNALPVYRGELYMEYHRGTYTTHSLFKYRHRKLEQALQTYEAVRVIKEKGPIDRNYWHRLSLAQFHDAIPGSSIRDVYEELGLEIEQLTSKAIDNSQREYRGKSRKKSTTVFNPLALPLRSVLEIPVPLGVKANAMTLVDNEDRSYPFQIQGKGQAGRVLTSADLKGLESRSFRLVKGTVNDKHPSVKASKNLLENGFVKARFDRSGRLNSLEIQGEKIQLSGPAAFMIHIDHPSAFDAWDIDHSATWLGQETVRSVKLKMVEKGPVRAILRGESPIGEHSSLIVDYVLETGSDFLKIDLTVDWNESHKLLRFQVPTDYQGTSARFGCPFGSIDRSQRAGSQAEEAQWEVPASRWMAVLDGRSEGLAIVTEAKYGFSCRDGVAGVSLLRSPKSPDPTTDQGKHRIQFALGRFQPVTAGNTLSTAAQAEVLYMNPLVTKGGSSQPPPFKLHKLGGVVPAWILPAGTGTGYIIRLHETSGANGHFEIEFSNPPKSIKQVDFLEQSIKGNIRKLKNGRYRVSIRQYQVSSLKIIP